MLSDPLFFLAQTTDDSDKLSFSDFYPGLDELFETGAIASNTISLAWDKLWKEAFNLDGVSASGATTFLFGFLANLGLAVTLFLLIFLAIQQFEMLNKGNYQQYLLTLLSPLLISIFLSNNGYLLAHGCYHARGVMNGINKNLLDITGGAIKLDKSFDELQRLLGSRLMIANHLQECESLTGDEQSSCLSEETQKIQEQIDKLQKNTSIDLSNVVKTYFSDLGDGISYFLNPGAHLTSKTLEMFMPSWESLVFSVLGAFMRAYQHFMEMAFFLTAIISPIAVGASLLPGGERPILAWAIGFLSVGFAKLAFNITAGLAAAAATNDFASMNDQLPLYIIFGLFAPVISASLSFFGGMATWRALSGAVEDTVGFGGKLLNLI
jgi:hypothetical protein